MDATTNPLPDNGCEVCTLCDNPGSIDDSPDVAQVLSNVRAFEHESFTVWRCRNCNSLHCREAVDLDHYYAHYFIQSQQLDYFTRAGFRQRKKWLQSAGVTRDHRILEWGCGNGIYLEYLRASGFQDIHGYDPYGSKYADRPSDDQRFDVVTSYEVIEHVPDPREFLREQAAYLNRGGLIALTTPNAAEIPLEERARLDLHQPYHRHMLSEQALVGIAEAIGLQVVQLRNSFWMHTKWPFVNWRFVSEYVWQLGNVVDIVTEDAQVATVLKSPKLLTYGFWGGYLPMKKYMHAVFRKMT